VITVMSLALININAPKEPYGIRDCVCLEVLQRRPWAEVAAATADFSSVETPFIIILSLFPAAKFLPLVKSPPSPQATFAQDPSPPAGRRNAAAKRITFGNQSLQCGYKTR